MNESNDSSSESYYEENTFGTSDDEEETDLDLEGLPELLKGLKLEPYNFEPTRKDFTCPESPESQVE